MGRAKKEQSRRKETVTIRLTTPEKRELEHCAGKLGMTQTEVILNGVKIISGMIEKHQAKKESATKEGAKWED